ncbi:hypothetical protein A2U01_0057447, partial [Trifolium medium]|nr:hypothetical protein [Trifolium medium]
SGNFAWGEEVDAWGEMLSAEEAECSGNFAWSKISRLGRKLEVEANYNVSEAATSLK